MTIQPPATDYTVTCDICDWTATSATRAGALVLGEAHTAATGHLTDTWPLS